MQRRNDRWRTWATAAALCFSVAGCETGPWPASYLTEAAGHATASEVRGKLGAPSITARGLDEGAVWTYHYARGWPGSAVYECYDYALKFDKKGIFQNWVQEECAVEPPTDVTPQEEPKKSRADQG